MDLSKAYDYIPHEIDIDKLECYTLLGLVSFFRNCFVSLCCI